MYYNMTRRLLEFAQGRLILQVTGGYSDASVVAPAEAIFRALLDGWDAPTPPEYTVETQADKPPQTLTVCQADLLFLPTLHCLALCLCADDASRLLMLSRV